MTRLFIYNFLLTLLVVINPFLITIIFDETYPDKSYLIITIIFSVYLIQFLLSIYTRRKCEIASFSKISKIRKEILNKVIDFDYTYSQKENVASSLEIIDNDIKIIHHYYNTVLFNIFNDITKLLFIVMILSYKSMKLGISFILVILSIFFILKKMKVNYGVISEEREYSSLFSQFLLSMLKMIEELRFMENIEYISNYFKKKVGKWEKLRIRSQVILYFNWAISVFLFGSFYIISLYVTGALVKDNFLQISIIFLIIQYSQMILGPIEMTQLNLQHYQKYKVSTQRCKDFIQRNQKDEYNISRIQLDESIQSINVKDISFTYNENRVLLNFNFVFSSPHSYGLYGDSGCGKSTLLKLISKKIPNQRGKILFDGINVDEIPIHLIHQYLAYVENESLIFSCSIEENIVMFSSILKDELVKILDSSGLDKIYRELIGVDEYLSLDIDAIHTPESIKQLVNITRYLLNLNRSIYIFDEAASSLSPELEQKVNTIILDVLKDKLIFIVSHQKSTLQSCTTIINLSQELVRE